MAKEKNKKALKKENFIVTNSGAGIKELPVEAIKVNSDYFKALLSKVEKKFKKTKQATSNTSPAGR